MAIRPADVTSAPTPAIVLAGGLARRMGGIAKPLLLLHGRPLLDHIADRLRPQTPRIALNVNADAWRYGKWGLPIVPDTLPDHPGPLAGVLAGMRWAGASGAATLLSVPGDTPFLPRDLLARLAAEHTTAVTIATSAGTDHPAVALWSVSLADELEAALRSGIRRVTAFAVSAGASRAGFPEARAFLNINTLADLARAEA